mmetsp:Transcript_31910/g.61405  ORF Transcript_31910/g.61405 Transcript_31910/m.61405 type:complete len:229 (+) Transcript_31910:17-703(+)
MAEASASAAVVSALAELRQLLLQERADRAAAVRAEREERIEMMQQERRERESMLEQERRAREAMLACEQKERTALLRSLQEERQLRQHFERLLEEQLKLGANQAGSSKQGVAAVQRSTWDPRDHIKDVSPKLPGIVEDAGRSGKFVDPNFKALVQAQEEYLSELEALTNHSALDGEEDQPSGKEMAGISTRLESSNAAEPSSSQDVKATAEDDDYWNDPMWGADTLAR